MSAQKVPIGLSGAGNIPKSLHLGNADFLGIVAPECIWRTDEISASYRITCCPVTPYFDGGNGLSKDIFMNYPKPDKKWRKYAEKMFSISASLVYPPDIYCLSCGRPVDPGHVYSLCEECLNAITWADRKTCRVCGKPLENWYPSETCSECLVSSVYYERGVTCFLYTGGARVMIKDLKYHGKKHNARIFGRILADKILYEELDFDVCTPVPMYWKKEYERGYNQATLIAQYTAENLRKPFAPHVLVRTRPTAPMSTLQGAERKKNVRGAFIVPEEQKQWIQNRTVLLVDDIYTTGATMNECARELRKAGAEHVIIASMASGRNQRKLSEEPDKT